MSGKNLELSLVMRLRDLASSGFTRAQRVFQDGIANTGKATDNLTRTVASLGKARSAAGVLGIRTEQNIQREIQRTEAAYNRLTRSGTMGFREQLRAAEATRSKLVQLNNEMGKYTLGQKAMRVGQAGAAVAGGLIAGGYVLKSAAERPMAYDRRLALMANTAYSERDELGRKAGKAELDKAIRVSTVNGHGTPEQAAETLNTLVGSGAMGNGKAGLYASMKLLPMLQEAAHGTGASANDLAQIAIAAKQNMGLTDEQIPLAISKAIRAGQEGGFELTNMSKWLPQQMAMAGNNGMKGMAGFESLIAANQATRMTAGTADEAGNNLVNLLQKVTSNDTANDFKKQNVDLYGSLTANMAKGMNSLEAFVGLVRMVGSKDKKYLELKAKADSAKSEPEKQKLYQSMADIMMAKGIGKTVQDRQALGGLFGMMSPTGKYHDVLAAVKKEQGTEIGISSRVVDSTLDAKSDRIGNVKTYAAIDALGAVEKPLGLLLDKVSSSAEAFPGFTAAIYGATTAVTALGVAAYGMAGLTALLGGKGGAAGGLVRGVGGALMTGARAATLPGLALMGAWEGGSAAINAYQGKDSSNMLSRMVEGTSFSDMLGEAVARSMAIFGNQTAGEAVQINLHLDGEQIAAVVNRRNASTAARN